MHFQKQDMKGTHYNWNTDDKKKIFLGQPTRRLFDRYNGDQVLFLINFYGSLSESFTPLEGRMIEYEIFHHLPLDAKSEISVLNWIQNTDFLKNESYHDIEPVSQDGLSL